MIWTNESVEIATRGKSNNKWSAKEIKIDSRLVKEGDLFIALIGSNCDGHDFINNAFASGAASVIIDHLNEQINPNMNYCLVDNTELALGDLAIFNRNRIDANIIAVTGSVGKTTTKEMLKTCISNYGKTFANYGNYNNNLGVSISLASTPLDVQYAIYEVGMNHKGEITPLSKMIKPDVAIITNVEPVHIEFFSSVEEIAKAKSEIFSGLNKDGYVIINHDNDYYEFLYNSAKQLEIKNIISFGQKKSDSILVDFKLDNESSIIKADIFGKRVEYKLNSVGIHNAINSIAVLSAISIYEDDLSMAIESLSKFLPGAGRGKSYNIKFDNKSIYLIDDSYNASPPSVKSALNVLGKRNGVKIAILADMKELGYRSDELHINLIDDIEINKIDKVIAIGEFMKKLYDILPNNKKLKYYENKNDIVKDINNIINDGDNILIKGSFSTGIHELAKYILNNSRELNDL